MRKFVAGLLRKACDRMAPPSPLKYDKHLRWEQAVLDAKAELFHQKRQLEETLEKERQLEEELNQLDLKFFSPEGRNSASISRRRQKIISEEQPTMYSELGRLHDSVRRTKENVEFWVSRQPVGTDEIS